jgi:hypothetical protein
VREPTGDGHELIDKYILMKSGEGEVMVGVTLNGNQKKLKSRSIDANNTVDVFKKYFPFKK